MKYLILLSICFMAISCSNTLSQKDTDFIGAKITLHNALSYSRFVNDSISGKRDTMIFSNPQLTVERYLDYCKAHNLDPIESLSKLSDK